jgi:hypothetical protein
MILKLEAADLLLRSSTMIDLQVITLSEANSDLVLRVIRPDWNRITSVRRFLFSYLEVPGIESLVKISSVSSIQKEINESLSLHGSNEIHSVTMASNGMDIETYGEVIHIATSEDSTISVDDVRPMKETILRMRKTTKSLQRDQLLKFMI